MERELIGTGSVWETDYPYTKGARAPWTPICKVKIPGANLIFIAGQVAYDDRGRIVVPDSMKAQAELAYANLKHALGAAGAKASDIVCERIYVVKEHMHHFMTRGARIRDKWFADNGVPNDKLPPMTLLGVARLSHLDLVLEVEVIAVTEA
ncbi:MAG: RidA family protein [Deltaproteobacteria bacterium]|nr:MAG: RidA family protein [Deltaproteobacteria bacterium]